MKIVIAGNYGAGNIGDEMILEGMIEMIKEIFPKTEITVLSGNPQETAEKHNVKSEEKFPAGVKSFLKSIFQPKIKTIKAVKDCDFFILGGGGLFGSLTFRANIIWAMQAFMANRCKKPVLMYGQSIGELKGKIRKWIVKRLFNKAKLIVVRDEDSKKRLKDVHVNKKIYIIPDLAFNIKIEEEPVQRENEMIVALRQIKDLTPLFKQNIAEFLNWIIKEKIWKVKFVDFQTGKRQGDYNIHKEIIGKISDKEKIEHIKEIENTKELIKIFSEAKFVLGMRLHSIITAIKTNTPFIAINYAPKVEAFLKYSNFDEYGINKEEVNFENLKKHFEKSFSDKEQFVSKMKEFAKKALQKHHEFQNLTLRNIFSNDS